ncbi:hypothetical protein [Actinomadura sp. WMMB 499]|uniref:hypothetical protein n=1 Tax=Actinomadura sp. WMMB 499 TaxID=1219491 RepID=UPI00124893E6|nr:hypothetical protein [Actinomadura sp. WMMB 499]QFG25326.1 hypothetical protein F7P10_33430 [Actinomadura sp. WMMB 499]
MKRNDRWSRVRRTLGSPWGRRSPLHGAAGRRGLVLTAIGGCAFVLPAATGCGETAQRQSFTDENGRACAYVLIEEPDGGKEVGDIDCDFPPGHVPSTSPSPTPTG